MKIERLKCLNFRNIEQAEIFPDEKMNVICGENAQGKTNLIEAIWLFTGAKSFRNTKDSIPVKFGCMMAKNEIEFISDGVSNTASMEFGEKRNAFLNEKSLSNPSKLAGSFNAIVFSPADLSLVKDGPSGRRKNIDILIGTQMVTKGLDFPNVTLVGVISVDTILNIDDYRSQERTFSVIEQVSGRAGRGIKPGRSIIQTYSPDDKSIRLAQSHSYHKFYEKEIDMRRVMWYPPFCDITSVIFSSQSEILAARCGRRFAKYLAPAREKLNRLQILGPVPAYVSKVKNRYIYRLTIKCENNDELNEFLQYARDNCLEDENYSSVSIIIDKNPNSMG